MPEGVDASTMAASSDSDVLVVMDLHIDTSMIEQGLAREVVNRYQKLRKKAGLTVIDAVEFYYEMMPNSNQSIFENALESQRLYLKTALGSWLMPLSLKPSTASVLFKEEQSIKSDDGNIAFTAIITPLTVTIDPVIVSENEEIAVYLASRDRSKLIHETQSNGKVVIDLKARCVSR